MSKLKKWVYWVFHRNKLGKQCEDELFYDEIIVTLPKIKNIKKNNNLCQKPKHVENIENGTLWKRSLKWVIQVVIGAVITSSISLIFSIFS